MTGLLLAPSDACVLPQVQVQNTAVAPQVPQAFIHKFTPQGALFPN
jgi:hypothetical protein